MGSKPKATDSRAGLGGPLSSTQKEGAFSFCLTPTPRGISVCNLSKSLLRLAMAQDLAPGRLSCYYGPHTSLECLQVKNAKRMLMLNSSPTKIFHSSQGGYGDAWKLTLSTQPLHSAHSCLRGHFRRSYFELESLQCAPEHRRLDQASA